MTNPDTHTCPICAEPFKPDDICATDIELLTVHAECLDGCEIVDLETGEPTDKPLTTYRYSEVMEPASPETNMATAARAFMDLFVVESGDDRGLSIDDIDMTELTHRFAALEDAMAGTPAPQDHVGWPRYVVVSEGSGVDARLCGTEAWGEVWSVCHFQSQKHVDEGDGIFCGFFISKEVAEAMTHALNSPSPQTNVTAWAMIHPDDPSVILKIEHDPVTVKFMKEENANCQFVPLYRDPSPQTNVKPLEWVLAGDGSTYHAQSILGRWARWEGHYLPPDGYGGIPCDDPVSSAQADYESRILPALITTAPQTNEPAGYAGTLGDMLGAKASPENHMRSYQDRVAAAHHALFHDDPTDIEERNARAFEEAIETAQAFGMTREEAMALVDYTFSRPIGDPAKEIGAKVLTAFSLGVTAGIDVMAAAEADLEKLQRPETIARIRAKRSTRHGRGPLPGFDPNATTEGNP